MSNGDFADKDKRTRHLPEVPQASGQSMPARVTGPLDEVLPWVVEFRVVGTASTIQVRVTEHMTIGREDAGAGTAPDINLSPYGAHVLGVSRRHAVIDTEDNHLVIRDEHSANGTRLNGYAVNPGQAYRLRHGDEVTFGQLHVQVLFAVVPQTGKLGTTAETIIPVMGHGEHVLIVEDDADVAAVFGMILEHAGYRVSIMNNAVSALGFISQKLPDAIVLDLMLPDMNGMDLLHYVRKKQGNRHVPLVVVSGATGGFQMNEALKAGADMFLGKPVGVDELVQAFGVLMGHPAEG